MRLTITLDNRLERIIRAYADQWDCPMATVVRTLVMDGIKHEQRLLREANPR